MLVLAAAVATGPVLVADRLVGLGLGAVAGSRVAPAGAAVGERRAHRGERENRRNDEQDPWHAVPSV